MGDAAPAKATLPALAIPYTIGPNGRAIYSDADLLRYAKQAQTKSIRRLGGRRRSALAS
jgi:hypothetical protein